MTGSRAARRACTPFICIALALGCASDGDHSVRPLPDDVLVGSCITASADPFPDEVPLCTVSLDGEIELIHSTITPGIRPALSPDRREIATVEGDTVVIRTARGETRRTLELPDTRDIDWMADGERLVVHAGDEASSIVSVVDVSSDERRELLRSTAFAGEMDPVVSVSPDGRRLALIVEIAPEASFQLVVHDIERDTSQVLYESEVAMTWPEWSSSGNEIAVARPHEIAIVDVATGAQTDKLPSDSVPGTPTWSPGGRRLAYVDARGALLSCDLADDRCAMVIDRTADRDGVLPVVPSWS